MSPPLETRAPIDAWLARVLTCELDDETAATMREEPLRGVLEHLEPELGAVWPLALEGGAERGDREEFARLFLLPGGVSPRAGTFGLAEGSHADGHTEALVERALALLGREPLIRSPWGRLPRDHFALILELVAHASRSEDPIDRALAAELDEALLGPRLVAFGEALVVAAAHPLYRAIGRLIVLTHDQTHDQRTASDPGQADAQGTASNERLGSRP